MAKIHLAGAHQIHKMSAKQSSAKEVSEEQSISEAGGIAQNVGTVINKWNAQLHDALEDWYNINSQIQDKLDSARFVIDEIKYAQSHYEWAVRSGVALNIPAGNYNKLMEAMSLLGIPASQRATGTLQPDGKYHMTASDFQQDRDLMIEYAKANFNDFIGEVSSLQHEETQIQLRVMYAFTSIQTNQKTLAGILSALKQMSHTVMNNIQ
ncbi:MAG TPA: hypothetical protein DIU37_06340 [Opitutae bacterium]|nr:hypothetical protein [Opitutae bacterium]|tara:strand:+ start:1821 stop:2447 length:627 start_codon:yes stop_codon:yes gene_type:complete